MIEEAANLNIEHGIHIVRRYEDVLDVSHKMSIEARLKGKETSQMSVKSIIGDFHGCGSWRVLYPSIVVSTMKEDLKMSYEQFFDPNDQSVYRHQDMIIFQRQVAPGFLPAMQQFNKVVEENRIPVVAAFEIDDWLFGIPPYNMAYDLYANKLGEKYLKDCLEMFDAMIVSTDYLKKIYIDKFAGGEDRIWVMKNHIPRFLWDFDIDEKTDFTLVNGEGKKPRILFAGGANRFAVKGDDLNIRDDIAQLEPVIRNTIDEFQWVFMGAQPLRLADLFDKGKIEHVPWFANLGYPKALKRLKVDIAISPLLINDFNKGKSNIKILEYGAVGLPSIYTDVTCYDELPDWMKVKSGDSDAWEAKIREYVTDTDLRAKAQQVQLDILSQYWLEDNVDKYRNTYREIILKVLKDKGSF